MRTQKGRRGFCAKCIQLIQSVWAESRACTLCCNIVYWRDFLPILTESAECIRRNILVFHFASYSIYTTYYSMIISLLPSTMSEVKTRGSVVCSSLGRADSSPWGWTSSSVGWTSSSWGWTSASVGWTSCSWGWTSSMMSPSVAGASVAATASEHLYEIIHFSPLKIVILKNCANGAFWKNYNFLNISSSIKVRGANYTIHFPQNTVEQTMFFFK